MNAPYRQPPTAPAATEVDVMPYISAVIDARWWIVLLTLLGALAAAYLVMSKPYMYESGAKVSVVDIEDPGGVSPDDRRASEVLTLVEHGFVMGTTRDNYDAVMLARLRSRDFTNRFLDAFNVFRHFYPEHWDEKKQMWRGDFKPDRGEVLTRFRDEVRSITIDEETDIITVAMRWPDPLLAKEFANSYVAEFNEFIREKTRREVDGKQHFLREELQRSDVVDMQQSIYRLIEAQTAIAMLVSAREEYALEVIDPASVPYRSYSVSRKKAIVAGSVAALFFSVFLILALTLAKGMFEKVIRYRSSIAATSANPVQQTKDNEQ